MSIIQLPSSNPITTEFGRILGYALNDGFHKGLDFSFGPDPYAYMPEDGNVGCVANNGNDGNAIYVWRDNRKHALCHLERFLVPTGSFQKRGTKVGIIGDTGYSKGKHLHYAVQVDSLFVDPRSLIGGKGAVNNNMTRQEAVAVVDAFFGRFTERKVKDSELEEYVQVLLDGQPDKLFSKAVIWDEVQRTVARRAGLPVALDVQINGTVFVPKGK